MGLDLREYGKMIRNIRERAGVSSDELAKMARISTVQNLTKFEVGRVQRPAYETIERLSQAVCRLPLIQHNDFNFDGYSRECVNTLFMFRRDGAPSDTDGLDKSALCAEWEALSLRDREAALIAISIMSDYQDFKEKLASLRKVVENSFEDTKDVDYCMILHDLLAHRHMGFYKTLNNELNDMTKTQGNYHAYRFITMIVHALSSAVGDYGDKAHG